jgi:hypothetical protein
MEQGEVHFKPGVLVASNYYTGPVDVLEEDL